MRLALIPPYANANSVQHTDYQLLLPQCLGNKRYVGAYRTARRNGSYMILDNGAAESVETPLEVLFSMAANMMVNEVVVPDTIGDAEATLKQALAAGKLCNNSVLRDFNYMAVVQGKSWGELQDCVSGFKALPWITTLGIPRHLLDLSEDMRINLVDHIRMKYGSRWQLHLLGMNRRYTNELISFGRAYNEYNVRGIDTCAPYLYAMNGKPLTEHGAILERPEDYFERSHGHMDPLYINLAIMKDWVRSNV